MTMTASMRALACAAFAFLLAPCASGGETFGTGPLGLEFASADEGFGIRRIVNRLGGGESAFLNSRAGTCDLWELEFHMLDSTGGVATARIDNLSPCARRRSASRGRTLAFRWEGLSLPGELAAVDVTAGVRLSEDGASADWTIKVNCRSEKWALYETRYPFMRNVVADGEADALLPGRQLGMRLVRKFKASAADLLECFCPSWRPPVVAFIKSGKGLLAYARDGELRYKKLMLFKGASLRYDTLVENAGVVGKAADSPGYSVRTTVFEGDWWKAAAAYREWAVRQKWAAKGPIATRGDFPRSLRNNAAYMVVNGASVTNIATKLRARWPGAAIGLDWAKWGMLPFDTNYPEMLPAQDGVRESMDFGRRNGILMKPYTNGRLWDKGLSSYLYAEADATKDGRGRAWDERYGKRHFAVMCPGSRRWRDTFVANASNVVETIGATALYVDQVACSRPMPCFDPSHGHPLGGGSWWADGCREMLGRLHDILAPKDVSISSEGACEAYLGVIDGYDLASTTHPEDVPFYTAVYGGYAVYNGSSVGDTRDFPAFFASQARSALWGCSLESGWLCNWPLVEKDSRFSDAFAALAELRGRHAEFLVDGRIVGEASFAEPVEELSIEWGARSSGKVVPVAARLPAVLGTVFVNAAGTRRAVAAANLSGEVRKVSFSSPFRGELSLAPYSAAVAEE